MTAWLDHPRLSGKPRIELIGIRLDPKWVKTGELITIAAVEGALFQSHILLGNTQPLYPAAAGTYRLGQVTEVPEQGKSPTNYDNPRHTGDASLCRLQRDP